MLPADHVTLQVCPSCGARNRVLPDRVADGPTCGRCHARLRQGAAAPAHPPAHPIAVSDQSFAAEVEQAALPVLVDFWAPWCGPCRAVAPMLEKLANDRAGRLKVAKVNVDENPTLARRFGIQSIPTLALFRGGRLIEQIRGAVPRATLEAQLARHGVG